MVLCYQNNTSKKVDLVHYQYSGAVHDVISGIGIVNPLHYDTKTNHSIPIDYRIYDKGLTEKQRMIILLYTLLS